MTTAPDEGGASALARTLGWLSGRRPRSPRADRALLAGAALLFVTAFAFGLRGVPGGVVELTLWPFVVLAVVAVPATNLANAFEYTVAARIEGQRVPLAEAVEVSVLSSAANLLPLPGAALVRVRALRRGGSTYRRAFSVTALVGGAWLATSLVLAGALLVVRRTDEVEVLLVAGVLVAGLTGTALAVVAVRAMAPPEHATTLAVALLGAEAVAVAVGAARFLLVLDGLGIGVTPAQAVSLTVAAVLASAVGFLPGGLGLREALAGVIAGLVGLPAAVGVLAAAVDRLVALPVLALLAAAFALRGRRGERR